MDPQYDKIHGFRIADIEAITHSHRNIIQK